MERPVIFLPFWGSVESPSPTPSRGIWDRSLDSSLTGTLLFCTGTRLTLYSSQASRPSWQICPHLSLVPSLFICSVEGDPSVPPAGNSDVSSVARTWGCGGSDLRPGQDLKRPMATLSPHDRVTAIRTGWCWTREGRSLKPYTTSAASSRALRRPWAPKRTPPGSAGTSWTVSRRWWMVRAPARSQARASCRRGGRGRAGGSGRSRGGGALEPPLHWAKFLSLGRQSFIHSTDSHGAPRCAKCLCFLGCGDIVGNTEEWPHPSGAHRSASCPISVQWDKSCGRKSPQGREGTPS